MKKYIIYIYDGSTASCDEVKDFSIPNQLWHDALFFYFVTGIYDTQQQCFIELHQESQYYYINAQIIPLEMIDKHVRGKQLITLQEQLMLIGTDITLIKLSNGEIAISHDEVVELVYVSNNGVISKESLENSLN